MADKLLNEQHNNSNSDTPLGEVEMEEGEELEPFKPLSVPPADELEEQEAFVYSPPTPTYEDSVRERAKTTASSSDNTVNVVSASRISTLDSLDVKKLKILRDDILAQSRNSSTPINRYIYMSKEVREKIKARLQKAYPDTDINSFSLEEYFDRIIRYELTKDSSTIYTVDYSSELIKIDITMSSKNDWVEVLHDKLIDTMSKVSGGKLLDELTITQHTSVVDALCGKLKKISDYPGPYETAARLLHIDVIRSIQAYRRLYESMKRRHMPTALADYFVTVDRFIKLLTEAWKPVMLAIKQLQRYNLLESLDHDLEGEYEKIAQKKAQSKENGKKATGTAKRLRPLL